MKYALIKEQDVRLHIWLFLDYFTISLYGVYLYNVIAFGATLKTIANKSVWLAKFLLIVSIYDFYLTLINVKIITSLVGYITEEP